MGDAILEQVLHILREENFLSDMAFPGQKYPAITEPVAAVHLEKVDRANRMVTVEVSILCPAFMGGACCEKEALRATEALHLAGAECIQKGCTYDGMSRVYMVSILASFPCVTGAEGCEMGPGFRVYMGETRLDYALSFRSQWISGTETVYEMGEDIPAGIRQGRGNWEITLEELIPMGTAETDGIGEVFRLRLESDTTSETYYSCRWTGIRREFTSRGLRRIRSGISLDRQEG